jgi:Mrp family chromosome partitioning ATPase
VARGRGRPQKGEIIIGTSSGQVVARVPGTVREEMRYLWTRLQVHGGDLPRSIGLTSRARREGVSFTSQALAAVLARTGETCLVEANWWGARWPIEDPGPGLAGLFSARASLDDALVSTNHAGLSLLPAGELVDAGQAVMANTESLRSVVSGLESNFRYVVIDFPAITSSAVALSFASACQGVLLVTKQRSTRIDQVASATEDLRHANLLGVVLNNYEIAMPRFLKSRLIEA